MIKRDLSEQVIWKPKCSDECEVFLQVNRKECMSLKLTLKYKISGWFPAKLKEGSREKKGGNLNNNPSVLVVCKDSDEAYFKALKSFVQHLKGEYGIREILVLFYAEEQEENLPSYLGHLKEYDFFCLNDLAFKAK